MLTVPALKPNEEPFNPVSGYPAPPQLKAGPHSLPLPAAAPGTGSADSSPEGHDPEDDSLARALDHALVKEAVTSLHIEDDEETEKLRAYTRTQICDIVPDYAKFITAQRDKYTHLLKTNSQRHFFQQSASAYFAHAPERARALRNVRIRRFQKETVERQNAEFLARALRPENLLNDSLQTRYRDMILHNLELLLDGVSPEERRTALDQAAKDMYGKVLDARLAAAPESLAPLLASHAVQRVCSRDELSLYRDAMQRALSSRRLSRKAAEWAHNGTTQEEAESMAKAQHPEESEQKTLLDFFARHRYNFNRKHCLQTILDVDNAWRALKQADYNPAAIPDWVKNGDPALLDCITQTLAAHEKNGGLHPVPDYAALLEFVEEFDPRAAAERLADAKNIYKLVADLGAPDSPAFLAVLRLLLGKSTPADRNRFALLSLACAHCRDADINPFLERVDECRRLRLQQDKRDELDPVEMRGIVADCLGGESTTTGLFGLSSSPGGFASI